MNNVPRNMFYEQLEKSSENKTEPDTELIRKTIDDAIKNKDRYVYLLISNHGISMSVYPYEPGHPKWIKVVDNADGKRPFSNKGQFRCPECGSYAKYMSPYCPMCGEQLGVCDA